MKNLKILATQDLHQDLNKWEELVNTCIKEKPDVVCITGDLFPKNSKLQAQNEWLETFKLKCSAITGQKIKLFVTLGNDDSPNLTSHLDEMQGKYFSHLNNRSEEYKGITFVGMPFVKDHPFGMKSWCRKEFNDKFGIDKSQIAEPVDVDAENKFIEIKNYRNWLKDRPSIYDQLNELAVKNYSSLKKSIWLIHQPPKGCGLANVEKDQDVGSSAVRLFIDEVSPAITLHGHIHESPYRSRRWNCLIGKTVAIQPGQMGSNLHYVTMNVRLAGKNRGFVEIIGMSHSVFGKIYNHIA